jgi:hypothetical protein
VVCKINGSGGQPSGRFEEVSLIMKRMTRLFAVGVAATSVALLLFPATSWAATPGAPTALTATAGNTQVVLTWTAPTGDPGCGGGGGCSDYLIEYSPNAGGTYYRVMDGVSTGTSLTVTGLTNTWTYHFRVAAVNSADIGPFSTAASAVPFVFHTAGDLALYSACPTGAIPAATFTDVTTPSPNIDCIKYYGITNGTTATTYSPLDPVTRWQMALFLTRLGTRAGITLPDGSTQGFTDISGESAEIQTAINQLKQLGVTVGKTATTYAPADNVTREEMALFISRLLLKTKVGPGGNEEFVSGTSGVKEIKSLDTDMNFTDLNVTTTMEIRNAVINLFNLGVTDSQTQTTYQPTMNMTRSSMATFMVNALAHTNARPAGFVLQASTYRVAGSPPVYFSVTHRTSDFQPIVGTRVDTFKYAIPGSTTLSRFDANGYCKDTLVTSVGNSKCAIDTSDPVTDAFGNLPVFFETIPTVTTQEIWAWTAATPVTIYDNDIYGSSAATVTVVTYNAPAS